MPKVLVIDCFNLEDVSKAHFEFTFDDLVSIIHSCELNMFSPDDEKLYNVLIHLRDEVKFSDVCAYIDRG